MLHKPTYLLCILALAMPVSCSQEAGMAGAGSCDAPADTTTHAIGWAVDNVEGTTRGMGTLGNSTIKDQKFGLFAAYTGHNSLEATTPISYFLYNHKFDNTEAIAGQVDKFIWHGVPKAYWPLDETDKITFFPYAPYDAQLKQLQPKANPVGTLRFDYRPDAAELANQLDLCFSKPIVDMSYSRLCQEKPGDLCLDATFKHCLCKVEFRAKYVGTLKAGNKVVVEELAISNVLSHRELEFNTDPSAPDEPYTWLSPVSTLPQDYITYELQRRSKQHLRNIGLRPELTTDFEEFVHQNGELYMVPQTHTGGKLSLFFSYVASKDDSNKNDVGEVLTQFRQEMDMPDVPWEAGKVVRYEITIDLGPTTIISINATISPWTDSGNDGGHDGTFDDHVMP